MTDVVGIEKLSKSYHLGGEAIPAVCDVSLTVPAGAFIALMGASGSGKTTLLNLAGGLDTPDRGRVIISGRDITAMSDAERTVFRRRHLGIVFQSYNLLPNLTAIENVMLPLLVDGRPEAEVRARTDELIALVRLGHRVRHHPAALSGGEQQRVAIARSLMNKPALILADEPTGNLDPESSQVIWTLLQQLCREMNTSILMVTHEAAAAAYADRVHVLRDGRLSGTIEPQGSADEALVATRYAELAD